MGDGSGVVEGCEALGVERMAQVVAEGGESGEGGGDDEENEEAYLEAAGFEGPGLEEFGEGIAEDGHGPDQSGDEGEVEEERGNLDAGKEPTEAAPFEPALGVLGRWEAASRGVGEFGFRDAVDEVGAGEGEAAAAVDGEARDAYGVAEWDGDGGEASECDGSEGARCCDVGGEEFYEDEGGGDGEGEADAAVVGAENEDPGLGEGGEDGRGEGDACGGP